MADEYVYVTGQDNEIYEVRPTEALLHFLQRLAEDEAKEQAAATGEQRRSTQASSAAVSRVTQRQDLLIRCRPFAK